jgi:hypothetical protein
MVIDNSSSSGADIDSTEATASEEGSNSVPLNQADQSSSDQPSEAKQDEKAEYKPDYANSYDGDWPSIDEQQNVIRAMYSSFDNAYSYDEMSNYLNNYYDYNCRQKFSFELNSYSKYNNKNHIIIMMDQDPYRSTNSVKYYRVDFQFEFVRSKDGISRSRYCYDIIGLDKNNKIVDRIEGKDC